MFSCCKFGQARGSDKSEQKKRFLSSRGKVEDRADGEFGVVGAKGCLNCFCRLIGFRLFPGFECFNMLYASKRSRSVFKRVIVESSSL